MQYKVQVWMEGTLSANFPGTEDELRDYLMEHHGDATGLDVDSQNWQSIIETEEHMTPEQNNGNDVCEIQAITLEEEPPCAPISAPTLPQP